MKPSAVISLIIIVVIINVFGAIYFYYYLSGQIEEARLIFEKAYGENADFNSIFWVCQKMFIGRH